MKGAFGDEGALLFFRGMGFQPMKCLSGSDHQQDADATTHRFGGN
jgi:hypothetical protein